MGVKYREWFRRQPHDKQARMKAHSDRLLAAELNQECETPCGPHQCDTGCIYAEDEVSKSPNQELIDRAVANETTNGFAVVIDGKITVDTTKGNES